MPLRATQLSSVSFEGLEIERRLFASLAKTLRGEPSPWPFGADEAISPEQLWPIIAFHGICLALIENDELDTWPAQLADRAREEARLQVLWEASHKDLLVRTLAMFSSAGIEVLINKGTALAYSVFPDPALRRRGDTDLLVRPRQRDAARRLLAQAGFTRTQASAMQEDWVFDAGPGFVHSFDLHWQPTSCSALRGIFDIEEAFARSVPLLALGPEARALDPVLVFFSDSLNHQLHRTSGYIVEDDYIIAKERLIWIFGTDLQARAFSSQQWQELVEFARAKGASELCWRTLERASQVFDTPIPADVRVTLGNADMDGPVDFYLFHDDTFGRFRANWKMAYDWGARFRMLRDNLVPSTEFMRRRFPGMEGSPVFALHARRMASGVVKLCRRALRVG